MTSDGAPGKNGAGPALSEPVERCLVTFDRATVAILTHEINSRLHALIGPLQLGAKILRPWSKAITHEDFEKIEELLGMADQSAHGLWMLLSNLLEFSYHRTGFVNIHHEMIDFEQALDSAVADVERIAAENGNRLVCQFGPLSTGLIDRYKLDKIVFNLLENACKFTRAGTVTLAAHQTPGLLVIEVTDTGVGIAQDQFDLIFEPFYQIDREQTPGIAGLGLGLTVVKGICDVLSGAVAVESAPGRGSRFQVTLSYRTA